MIPGVLDRVLTSIKSAPVLTLIWTIHMRFSLLRSPYDSSKFINYDVIGFESV